MTKTIKLLLLSTVLSSGFVGTAAAQVAATPTGDPVADAKIDADRDKDSGGTNDTVVVTGTRIVRLNNTSAAPITTVTAAEIVAQGATTIEEVLNRLPQVQANSEQNYAESSGAQRIKLRNLGFERTLPLIDGLRVGLSNGLDTSIIPNALVERVDVLSGGASSVYGSDAISGVVNFVLKTNFDGVRLDANYSFYNHDNRSNAVTDAARRAFFAAPDGTTNDGGRSNVTLAAGKNLFDGALNVSGFVNYRHSELIRLGDRSSAACEVTQPTRDGPLACSIATFTGNGTIIPQSGANAGRVLVNNPDGSRTFVPINSGPNTAANPFDGLSFQREFERINYGGSITAKLSNAFELYGTALFYKDKSQNPILNRTLNFGAYGAVPYSVPCNNPFLSASQAQTLCGAAAGTATAVPIDVRYRFDGAPPVLAKFINKGVRVAGGVRGRILDDVWRYDLAGVYAKNTSTSFGITNPDIVQVNRSLNVTLRNGVPTCVSVIDGTDPACRPFNAFIPFNSDPALSDYFFSGRFNGSGASQSGTPRMWQALATISGDLGKYGITSPLAEQGIAVAFGAEYRNERFVSSANAEFRRLNAGNDVTFRQNVKEANAEVQVPLVENQSWTKLLQLNGGYRISKYNRLEGAFSTWKLEGIWSPFDDIGFRGSYNKAQRAPTVIEADQASNINFVTVGSRNDPCASTPNPTNPNQNIAPTATLIQCRATGLPDNLYGSATLSCPDGACTIRNGGFGLTPETAFTKTFGVVLRPRFVPGLTLSADRVLVDLDDSIGYFAANDFLTGCLNFQTDYYCRGVVRNPGTGTLSSVPSTNPTTGYIAQGTTNAFKSTFHSWDFQGQYNRRIGNLGRFDLSFNASLATRVGGQDAPELAAKSCAGLYGQICRESLPKWTHTLRGTFTTPDDIFNISLNWRHRARFTIDYNAENPAAVGLPYTAADRRQTYGFIPATDYLDISTGFNVSKQFSLRLAVNNVFDTDPPLVPNTRQLLGLLRSNTVFGYDQLGRQIVAGVGVNF